MSEPTEQRDLIDMLADEFTQRLRAGERPSIQSYVEKYPQCGAQIKTLFPTIHQIESVKQRHEQQVCQQSAKGPDQLVQLGDFQVVREVGRGGMGIVYEAIQQSLGRRVAVKVLPRQLLLDEKHLQRFEREARTAAQLHHTNIVPILGVGEHDGYHFYVMQFIDGDGLDKFVAATNPQVTTAHVPRHDAPTQAYDDDTNRDDDDSGEPPRTAPAKPLPQLGIDYYRRVANIGQQVADALDYAHQRQVLHRDIKPANLLVDEDGIVWVTDFGLAKAFEHDDVSRTGEVVGTVRYMAPEQFLGRADARSDLYSLGLTLYELLALQPAFDGSRRSKTIGEAMRVEPPRPRAVNPAIPQDLETIVLKAIAIEPERRYATARDLADDLSNYLEDRPIAARRATMAERLWRWCRRNRTVASLATMAALLLITVAIVSTFAYFRVNAALREAELTSTLATDALDQIFEDFAAERTIVPAEIRLETADAEAIELPTQPVLSEQSATLLHRMLEYYDDLAMLSAGDDALAEKIAEANRKMGDIHLQLGQHDKAQLAYNAAIAQFKDLPDSVGQNRRVLRLASTYNQLGNAYREAGEYEQSEAAHQDARAILEPLVPLPVDSSSPPELRYELARTMYLELYEPEVPENAPGPGGPGREPPGHGEGPPFLNGPPRGGRRPADPTRGNDPDADPRDGRPGRPPRRDGPPPHDPLFSGKAIPGEGPPHVPPDLDRGRPGPGKLPRFGRRETGPLRELKDFTDPIVILDALVAEFPEVPEYAFLRACCYREQSAFVFQLSAEEGRKWIDEATVMLQRLVETHGNVPDYRYELIETYAKVSTREPELDPLDRIETESRLLTALKHSEQLIAAHPNVPQYVASRVQVYFKLAAIQLQLHEPLDARASYEAALNLQRGLVQQFPDVPSYGTSYAAMQLALARMLIEQREFSAARELVGDSIDRLQANYEQGAVEAAAPLADAYRTMGRVLESLGEVDLGKEFFDKSRVLHDQLHPRSD